jgi:Protein of unknown function (DUF3311)
MVISTVTHLTRAPADDVVRLGDRLPPGRKEMGQPGPQRKYPPSRIVAGLLLLANVVFLTCVPIYARATPKLGDFPFFYWYLLIWVPISGLICFVAYLLVRRPAR